MNKKDNENIETKELIKALVDLEKVFWKKSQEFSNYTQQIEEILDKKQSDSKLLSDLNFPVTSIAALSERMFEKCSSLKKRIFEQMKWCSEEKELETFDIDHTIPLQEHNPLREAIDIDEKWIINNNAQKIEEWIKSNSIYNSPVGITNVEIYEKLRTFIDEQNLGRHIFTRENSPLEGWHGGHRHPLGFIRRDPEENEQLENYGDWQLLFYDKELANRLYFDHDFDFEFGILSNPYSDPIPEGVHRLALLKRKGSNAILEATVQPIPFKYWHPDTNGWLMKIRFAKDVQNQDTD